MICPFCQRAEMQSVKDDRDCFYSKCPRCGATDTGKLPLLPIPQTWKTRLKGQAGYGGMR